MSEIEEEIEIIDKPSVSRDSNHSIFEMVRWWEKKRLYYNLILIAASVLAIQSSPFINIPDRYATLITAAIFNLIGANFCYSLGWGIGMLKMYYFKSHPATTPERWTLFIIGSAFSFLATFIGL